MRSQPTEPIREVDRITVTRIRAVTGEGVEADPVRIVTLWITDEGEVISYLDPVALSEEK